MAAQVGAVNATNTFSGDWVMVDHSASGFPLYVDKGELRAVGDKRRADIMYIDQSGRIFERLLFDCKTKDMSSLSDPVGSTQTAMPDLIGEFPREDSGHASARDFACFGKRSKPESAEPIVHDLPEHL
jgi:hypothetical protein